MTVSSYWKHSLVLNKKTCSVPKCIVRSWSSVGGVCWHQKQRSAKYYCTVECKGQKYPNVHLYWKNVKKRMKSYVVYTQHEVFKMTNSPWSTLIIIKNATTSSFLKHVQDLTSESLKKNKQKKKPDEVTTKKTEALNESPGQQQQQWLFSPLIFYIDLWKVLQC